jgi:tetratricopeptide (TPR) repeat protein
VKRILTIVFLGLLTYFPIFFNGFVWDDEEMFRKGISIQTNAYFRPVISAIYWGIYNIFGPKPFFFHFFQLIFHIIVAILIYYLFKRFFKEVIALILALIFLVHPTNVEAISFASAMQEVTFTLVGIAGSYIFVSSKKLSIAKVCVVVLLLLTALLMKETAIVFFILVFCYLLLFKRGNQPILIDYSILTVILLMGYYLFRVSGGNLYIQGQGIFPIMRVPLLTRLMNIPMIIEYYLSKFFYPMNLGISQNWVVKSINFNNFFLPLISEILFFAAAVIYSIKKRDKIFLFFLLWFLIGLLPHLQIIPLNMTVAERWLYFPMIGALGMIGSALNKFEIRNSKFEKYFITFALIIISIFSVRSFVRTLDWKSGLSLFSRDIRTDSSFDLQSNYGTELSRIGRYKEAKEYFEISIELAPYWWVNWNNLGVVYAREKNYQKAIEYFQKSIANGQYYLAYENLAKILVLYGNDQKKTEEFLQRALRLFPENKNLILINSNFQEKKKK